MADRTHFYPVHKTECDQNCQSYDTKTDSLYFCEHFHILGDLPTGDYGAPITRIQGVCVYRKYNLMEENI